MSSGKTETLGLNQWQLSDAFLMEEMNADNRKVDASIARKAELVKLKEIIATTGGVSQIDVDVGDIDFTAWQYVILDVDLTNRCYVRNGGKDTGCGYAGFCDSQFQMSGMLLLSSFSRVVFLTNKSSRARVLLLSAGGEGFMNGYDSNGGFKNIKTLNFVTSSSGSTMSAGSSFVFWGVKG